jgi:hypothetical protein
MRDLLHPGSGMGFEVLYFHGDAAIKLPRRAETPEPRHRRPGDGMMIPFEF